MLIASIIALLLNIQLTDLDSFINEKVFNPGFTKMEKLRNSEVTDSSVFSFKNVLVVEDSVRTGHSISVVKERIRSCNFSLESCVNYLAAYVTPKCAALVDYYFTVVEYPRVFEWNYLHNALLINACRDIDGVLNFDPSSEENDDGEKYHSFLKKCLPKLTPTRKIGYLVTSRLEKYRKETETWLANHNIEYGKLIMLDGYTAEERRNSGIHARHKATVYAKLSDSDWFIESNKFQAEEINRLTGKAVFCTENQTWYNKTDWYLQERDRRTKDKDKETKD